MRGLSQTKIALVHDDLMQWGGAEKVFAQISEIFPQAPIYTALADLKNPLIKKNFKGKKIITSFLQKIPFSGKLYKPLLPLYPIAFEQFDFSQFDLVISHTTRFAKAIITKPETVHICYIHTPPRFLWNFSGENNNFLPDFFLSALRKYDLISANRVDFFISGSENCRQRVKKVYEKDSKVLYPFSDTKKVDLKKSFNGNYYLIVSRLNKYKKIDIAVSSFNKSGRKLMIVGTGPEYKKLNEKSRKNISFLGRVSDELLESLLAGCKGLVIMAEEDFGMTAIEAQSFGKAVVCFSKGGSLETVINGKTGVYFDQQNASSLNSALEKFETLNFNSQDCVINANKFSKDKFKEKLLKLINQADQTG